jgi:hypothetical protein
MASKTDDAEEALTGKCVLISQEGEQFNVDKQVACMSELVKTMMDDEEDGLFLFILLDLLILN